MPGIIHRKWTLCSFAASLTLAAATACGGDLDQLTSAVGRVDTRYQTDAWDDAELAAKVSDAAVAHRKEMIIRAGAADVLNVKAPGAKHQFPVVLCRLMRDPADQIALDYIPFGMLYRGQGDDFGKSSLSRIWCQFGSLLAPDVIDGLRQEVTTYDRFFGGGTENHIAMHRTTGFLFGEQFPEETFHYDLSGKQVALECRDYMRRYGQTLYASSMVEYASPLYHAVNTAAWLNVADFARDDTARLMARAILDWMFADLALNYHHGIIIPPLQREKGYLTGNYQVAYARTQTAWTAWLYFGGGLTPQTGDEFPEAKYLPLQPYGMSATLHAVSPYVPDPVIGNIGAKRVKTPYTIWQSRGNWPCIEAASVNPYGKTEVRHEDPPNPHYHLRSVYMNRDYTIGVGYFTEDIMNPLLRTAVPFAVAWQSDDERNYLLAPHPFWFTERKWDDSDEPLGDEDWLGISPFCQAVHWENAAVLLYDIPERDPYEGSFGKGSPKWPSERTDELIQSAFVYVPEAVDQRVQVGPNFFLREGDVYIAIRPLADGAHWADTRREGYVRLALPGALTGFAIELGDRREFGSFERFQEKLSAARLDTSRLATDKQVIYHSTRGHRLCLRHRTPGWLPDASVNGMRLDFNAWPTCQSPHVTCENRILDVNDGHAGFTVDWSGELPKYTRYTLTDSGRTTTRREFIQDGRLIVER